MKIRCGSTDQHGDGVFKLFALLAQQNELGARGVEKSFFLRDIQAGSYAATVARIYQVQTS